MTDQERLERRVRLAEAMGWVIIETTRKGTLLGKLKGGQEQLSRFPDFDNDAEAREGLLKWAINDGYDVRFDMCEEGEQTRCHVARPWEMTHWQKQAETYTEALLSAIDAAIITGGKAES